MKRRLHAEKKLVLSGVQDSSKLSEELFKRAWALATQPQPARVLIYCNSRTDAVAVKEALDNTLKKEGYDDKNTSELLVGERRVREREQLFKWLQASGFVGEVRSEPQAPTFLVATAAGEVGVDLDADHMVCDLVEWERMVQRLGRVNRRGSKQAFVEVVLAPPKDKKRTPMSGANALHVCGSHLMRSTAMRVQARSWRSKKTKV